MAEDIYENIGKIFGKDFIDYLEIMLKQAGFNFSPLKMAGGLLVISILLTTGFFSLASGNSIIKNNLYKFLLIVASPIIILDQIYYYIAAFLLAAFFGVSITFSISYVLLKLSSDDRKNKVEEVFPDFLVLAAANCRAGMTIDQALWNAAKPEFGLLAKEIQIVAKKSFAGEPFENAIEHLSKSFNSRIVSRAVSLIKQGMAAGSEIALILEKTAQDCREMQIIKKDISSSLVIYMIFIGFAAAIGTPFLYSVATKLVYLMEDVFSSLPITNLSSLAGFSSSFIKPKPPIISYGEFSLFVFIMIIITSLSGSILMGIITKGNKTEGLKYFPFILLIAFCLYFAINFALDVFVGSLGALR
ncbi:MAG: type II secretion system F family protein [Candidatus Micrarchaeota archaeon]|nr:type II secretion system F family protein [Candidatus Micrarchaeota archaeon]